jgi:hypothetical protein
VQNWRGEALYSKSIKVMFDRLYTLRNQLLHGGATWNGAVNRAQITQGADPYHNEDMYMI